MMCTPQTGARALSWEREQIERVRRALFVVSNKNATWERRRPVCVCTCAPRRPAHEQVRDTVVIRSSSSSRCGFHCVTAAHSRDRLRRSWTVHRAASRYVQTIDREFVTSAKKISNFNEFSEIKKKIVKIRTKTR